MNIEEKLKDEDVVGAYTYLLKQLWSLFDKVEFTEFKRACMLRGAPLQKEYKDQVEKAKVVDDIFKMFDNNIYCNWLNVRLLKRIAKNIDNEKAVKYIEIYEECAHSKKVSDVKKYFPICFDESTMTVITVEINKKHDITVREIIKNCEEIEKIMDLYVGAASAISSGPGCLKITIVIPLHCTLHAFKMAKMNFLKFRQFHIQYLEIESYPKVFALNHPDKENSLAVLSSTKLQCM